MWDEKRLETRAPFVNTPLSLSFIADGEMHNVVGLTLDRSENGVCLMSYKHFDADISIMTYGKATGNIPRYATVRWCDKITDGLYRTGISFS